MLYAEAMCQIQKVAQIWAKKLPKTGSKITQAKNSPKWVQHKVSMEDFLLLKDAMDLAMMWQADYSKTLLANHHKLYSQV